MTEESAVKAALVEKPKKKPVNGKAKGSGFENTIAKLFSATFAPLEFRRSQSSGAILGGQNHVFLHKFSDAAKALFVGDIVPTNEADVEKVEGWRFRFTVECKFYKEADGFSSLFKNPQLISWWEQACADASKISDKAPILIFKFNHTPIYAGIDPTLTALPAKMLQTVSLRYYVKDLERRLEICHLDELLKEQAWWKSTTTPITNEPQISKEDPQAAPKDSVS